MHFQIFIPGVQGADAQHLVDVGLESLQERAQFLDIADGPDSQAGVLVSWIGGRTRQLGYMPDRQTWVRAMAFAGLPIGRYAIGFWNDSAPTPADLQRDYRYAGPLVQLGDRQQWILPKLRQLPMDVTAIDDGRWQFDRQRQFWDLFLDSQSWCPIFTTAEYDLPLYATAAEFVFKVLCLNYRLTLEVANHLKLFSTGDGGTVPLAASLICQHLE